MKPAFSTVACPEWTLEEVATAARSWGYLGVELRTFGYGASPLSCDPGLTGATKARTLLNSVGVEVVCLASSLSFDHVVTPPLIGNTFLFDQEGPVRKGKALVDMAVSLECPYVRVFGFQASDTESMASAVGRITDRLGKVVDYARNSGVTILIENGGSFETAAQLSLILDTIDHPLLAASYSLPIARVAGEPAVNGVNVLGEKLRTIKVKDFADGVPCHLGAGSCEAEQSVRDVAATGFDGWVVFEHDRMWFKELGDPSAVLEAGAKSLYRWVNTGSGRPSHVTL